MKYITKVEDLKKREVMLILATSLHLRATPFMSHDLNYIRLTNWHFLGCVRIDRKDDDAQIVSNDEMIEILKNYANNRKMDSGGL